MKFGTTYEQGDIVLIPYPFTDLTTVKKRPVLVLSNKNYNSNSDDIVTCGITSQLKDDKFSIVISQKDLSAGSLPKTSRIKTDNIFTLEKSLVVKKIGKVNKDVIKQVKYHIAKLME